MLKQSVLFVVFFTFLLILGIISIFNLVFFQDFESVRNSLTFFEISLTSDQLNKLDERINFQQGELFSYLVLFIITIEVLLLLFLKKDVFKFCCRFYHFIKKGVLGLFANSNQRVWVIVSCSILVLGSLAYVFPLRLDELFTFNYFISKGVLVSLSYYPGPNNHVLYSVLGAIIYKVTGNSVLSIRLISGFVSIIAVWLVVLKAGQNKKQLIIGGLLLFHPMVIYYAFMGRGYAFLFCIAVISVFFIRSIKKSVSERENILVMLFFLQLIGAAVVPVFAFFSLGVLVYLLLNHVKVIPNLSILFVYLFGLLLFLMFYQPIITFNSLGSVVSNSWVKGDGLSFIQLKEYWFTIIEILGFQALFSPFLLTGLIFYLLQKKQNRMLCFSFVLIPVLYIAFRQTLIPVRTLLCFLPLILLVDFDVKFIKWGVFVVGSLFLQGSFQYYSDLKGQNEYYLTVEQVVSDLKGEKVFSEVEEVRERANYENFVNDSKTLIVAENNADYIVSNTIVNSSEWQIFKKYQSQSHEKEEFHLNLYKKQNE